MYSPNGILTGECITITIRELTVNDCDTFFSNITNERFNPILKSSMSLTCVTENVIYLISCRLCKVQYIGETINSIQK